MMPREKIIENGEFGVGFGGFGGNDGIEDWVEFEDGFDDVEVGGLCDSDVEDLKELEFGELVEKGLVMWVGRKDDDVWVALDVGSDLWKWLKLCGGGVEVDGVGGYETKIGRCKIGGVEVEVVSGMYRKVVLRGSIKEMGKLFEEEVGGMENDSFVVGSFVFGDWEFLIEGVVGVRSGSRVFLVLEEGDGMGYKWWLVKENRKLRGWRIGKVMVIGFRGDVGTDKLHGLGFSLIGALRGYEWVEEHDMWESWGDFVGVWDDEEDE